MEKRSKSHSSIIMSPIIKFLVLISYRLSPKVPRLETFEANFRVLFFLSLGP